MATDFASEVIDSTGENRFIHVVCGSTDDAVTSMTAVQSAALSSGLEVFPSPPGWALPRCQSVICNGAFVEFTPAEEVSFMTMRGRYGDSTAIFTPAAISEG